MGYSHGITNNWKFMKNAEQPAHPHTVIEESDPVCGAPIKTAEFYGLTKREYFAGLAMQGILSRPYNQNGGHTSRVSVITTAINHADELLKQLES